MAIQLKSMTLINYIKFVNCKYSSSKIVIKSINGAKDKRAQENSSKLCNL